MSSSNYCPSVQYDCGQLNCWYFTIGINVLIDCYGLLCLKGEWKEQKLVMPHEETLLMILRNELIELY